MKHRLRAGIIGAGIIGDVHVHAVRVAGGEVTRVAASRPDRSDDAVIRSSESSVWTVVPS